MNPLTAIPLPAGDELQLLVNPGPFVPPQEFGAVNSELYAPAAAAERNS